MSGDKSFSEMTEISGSAEWTLVLRKTNVTQLMDGPFHAHTRRRTYAYIT